MRRAWNEAEHHLEVARRLGEDVPGREDILEPPERWSERLAAFPRLLLRDERADLQFGFFPPEKIDRDLNRLRALLGGAPPTLILCDNEGQLERLEELLEEGAPGACAATLAIGALDGGFVDAGAPGAHRPRDLPPRPPAPAAAALPPGGAVGGHRAR